MVSINDSITEYIEKNLKKTRLKHTYSVVEEAKKLAELYGENPKKAETAALFHDMCKWMPADLMNGHVKYFGLGKTLLDNNNLAHSKVAAELMKKDYGITDEDVINAVAFHTTGRKGMSTLEKIIFLADAIEPGRDYPGVDDIRKLACVSLDKACIASLERTVEYIREKGEYLDTDTLGALEDLKEKQKYDRT